MPKLEILMSVTHQSDNVDTDISVINQCANMTENKKYPRVLVVSHNVFSPNSSMGRTLMNFFKGWDRECLAQLYLHMEVPTTNMCTNYYRVTDFENLKKRSCKTGNIFGEKDIDETLATERADCGVQAKMYQYGRKRKPYMYVGRNMLWGLNKWDNSKLNKWLDEFNPEVIFFASGDYAFLYKITLRIAKRKNIPVVTYICDDYYFIKQKSISLLYWINQIQFSHTIKRLFQKNKQVISICNKITEDYTKEFNVNAHTIMTSTFLERKTNQPYNSPIKISYLGNLGYKRYIPLTEIGRALKKISGGKVLLDVYSTESRDEVLCYLTKDNGINFMGAISYDKVINIMHESDILVHVEAMDDLCREKVKYSVSTKIADTMACGTCLFAYGPEDIASIEYLKDNNCACVVTDKKQLESELLKLVTDEKLRAEYVENALQTAQKNHCIETNAEKFREILSEAVKK